MLIPGKDSEEMTIAISKKKYTEFHQTQRFQILLRKSLGKRLLKDQNVNQIKPLHAFYTLS